MSAVIFTAVMSSGVVL